MGRTLIVFLLVLSSLSFFFPFDPSVRWFLTYFFIPVFALIIVISRRKILLSVNWGIAPFSLLLISGFHNSYSFSVLHWLIYACSIFLLILLRSYSDFMNHEFQKKLIITGFLFAIMFIPTWSVPNSLLGVFLKSDSIFEGNLFSFIWLPLMFSSRLSRGWKILVFLMLLLTLKRIVFIAFIVFFIIDKLRLYKFILPIFLFAAILNLSIVTGIMDGLIEEITGVNSYVLTSGRRGLNSILTESLNNQGYINYLFGNGAGVSGILVLEEVGRFHLPHNDVLRILVDNGLLGLVSLILPIRFIRSLNAKLMYGSYLFCLLTDNTLLYLTVTTIVFGLIMHEESSYISKNSARL